MKENAMKSFRDLYGDISLNQLFEDWQDKPLEIDDPSNEWLHFPPPEFLAWVRDYTGFPSYADQKAPPSFLTSQSHRIWLSTKLVIEVAGLGGHLVDLGSFPFAVPMVLRDYFGYHGPITATAIQPLSAKEQTVLNARRIEVALLDLDPFVRDPAQVSPLPTALACAPGSCDVVSMYHVIEHLYHPMGTLREAHRILRPGGKLLITTDNAMMLNTLISYVSGYGYIFEPVATTSAMAFHDWRGHVRYFTSADLQTMAEAAGFSDVQLGFEHVFYDAFHDAHYAEPRPMLSGWKYRVLREHRQFANDVFLVATKVESH